ncbi:MAG: PD-(D/E)XK nuclease domain-containing protein, partial [Bacteroidales bacterium]
LFGQNLERAKEIITEITENKTYLHTTQLQISFDMKDFKEGNYIAEGLFYAGILTYSNQMNTLKIPNLVTYDFALDYFNELQNFHYKDYKYTKWILQYKQQGDAVALVEGFFKDIIQKFPGQFFANVNESFYHGLFFQVLYNHTEKDLYEVLPEFNLPQGRADLMLRTYPNQTYTPIHLHDLFELKRVPKDTNQAGFDAEFAAAKEQVLKYKTGDYADFRAVAVCFRGNTDVKVEVL